MFDKWLKIPAHYYLRVVGLLILAVGILLHNTLMSIGTIWITANWLIEAKFLQYFNYLKQRPLVWLWLLFLLLNIVSLLWSSDVSYGLDDLRKKLPFFAVPIVLGLSSPLDEKSKNFLFASFIFVTVLTTGINFYRFQNIIDQPADIREMSYFISHVRLSVAVIVSMLLALSFWRFHKWRIVLIFVLSWLAFYTFIAQVLNGYIIIASLLLYSMFCLIKNISSIKFKILILVLLVVATILSGKQVYSLFDKYISPTHQKFEELDKYTANGNTYVHDTSFLAQENGNYVWIYVAPQEVEKEWNKRSTFDYHGEDAKGNPMFGTILRYMTSKGMRKDSLGVWQLTSDEISEIEQGSTNFQKLVGLEGKMIEFAYAYEAWLNGGDPNGHSLLQRMEHLRIGWKIVQDNWLVGVGIGDVKASFDHYYSIANSKLDPENRHRAHNQYLTFWISLGIVGLLSFLAILFYPLVYNSFLFWERGIWIALMVSLFFQDMLETQAGVSIFGVFYAILAFSPQRELSCNSEIKLSSEEA